MRKILNKLTCMAVSLTFLMGCMATPAFVYSSGETSEDVKAPSIFETEEEPESEPDEDAERRAYQGSGWVRGGVRKDDGQKMGAATGAACRDKMPVCFMRISWYTECVRR